LNVTERVAAALACSAVDRELSGVVLFDLDPGLIDSIARWLSALLGSSAPPTQLGRELTEDSLWEHVQPRQDAAGFRLAPGPLAGYDRQRPEVVVVPDLALLSLPAARAAVTMIGADAVHLERFGRSEAWVPVDRWIAAVRRDDVGQISPHLLDRFAVRVDAKGLARPALRAADLDAPPAAGPPGVLGPPDPAWLQAIQEGGPLPEFPADAVNRVLELLPSGAPGIRRELALGRLARALARLAGAAVTTAAHVDAAAELTGLAAAPAPAPWADIPTSPDELPGPVDPAWPPVTPPDPAAGRADDARRGEPEGLAGTPASRATLPDGSAPGEPGPGAADPGIARLKLDETDVDPPAEPYPEDAAKPDRDADPLRIGWPRALSGPPHGHPSGTLHARDLRDIAVIATLLRAAMFQAVRCPSGLGAHHREGHQLHIVGADLLRHRRARRSGGLLVLLLDHTCREPDWDWYEPLAPYLRWAYAQRAPVSVVEVGRAVEAGRAVAVSELRAQYFRARGLLDPRVAGALDRDPGRATPLAHGLALAARVLRHDTQQGSVAVADAMLVVVTDGRGNVPLSASTTGRKPVHAGRAGVADALRVAGQIKRLRRVRRVVIDPGPRPYGHLTADLARALGAPLALGRPSPRPASADRGEPAMPGGVS
jgi:magnesium chelatase subunit D